MNRSDVPTHQKIMVPLRLSPYLYEQMIEEVQKRKRDERGYSINKYLTEILTKDLEKK